MVQKVSFHPWQTRLDDMQSKAERKWRLERDDAPWRRLYVTTLYVGAEWLMIFISRGWEPRRRWGGWRVQSQSQSHRQGGRGHSLQQGWWDYWWWYRSSHGHCGHGCTWRRRWGTSTPGKRRWERFPAWWAREPGAQWSSSAAGPPWRLKCSVRSMEWPPCLSSLTPGRAAPSETEQPGRQRSSGTALPLHNLNVSPTFDRDCNRLR